MLNYVIYFMEVNNMKLIPKGLKLIVPKGLGRGTEVPPLAI